MAPLAWCWLWVLCAGGAPAQAGKGSRCPQGRRCHGFGLILRRALFLPARLFGRDLSSVPREQPSAPRCRGEGLQWQQVKRPRSPPSLPPSFSCFFLRGCIPMAAGSERGATELSEGAEPPLSERQRSPLVPTVVCCHDLLLSV